MCLSSSSKKTSTTAPTSPAVQSAYNQVLSTGQSLASQPLTPYNGQLVAPLNQTQNTAIQDISNAQGTAQPYLTEAANYAQLGATPLTYQPYTQANVDQYYSPFQNDVVNSTEAQFNNQNAIQDTQLQGNVAAAGALGGDREAILQSQLANQQQLAEAPAIANLENTGFTNAQGQFNTQNQLGLTAQQGTNQANQAAASTIGNIGATAENTALAGANSLLNAGTTQQQVAQEQLNVPYEQYLQQQAYPYQSNAYLASLLPGVAQGTGISTTGNTTSAPALLGGTGSGSFLTLAHGGRSRLAPGGMPYGPVSLSDQVPGVPNADQSYIPTINGSGGFGSGQGGQGGPTDGSQPSTGNKGGSSGPSAFDSFLFGNPATSANGAESGLIGSGGLNSTMASLGDTLASGATDALAFLGLAHGGRPRLDGGGDTTDQPLVINPMDPGELRRGGRSRLDDGGLPDAQRGDWFPGQSLLEAAYSPRYRYFPSSDRGPAPTLPAFSDPAAPTAAAPKFDVASASPPARATTPVTLDAQPPAAVPPANDNSLANVNVTPQANPTWDNGEPVNKGLDEAWQPGAAGREVIPQHTPSIWPTVLAGIGGLFNNREGAIPAAMAEYEKDANPVVDHSGAEMLVRYNNGPTFGTGIPTESALNARAMNDYRLTNMDTIQKEREDAIAQRASANQNTVAERATAAANADKDRQTQLQIERMREESGRYGQPVPGNGIDPATGKPVPGAYVTDLKTGEMIFHPGNEMTARTPAPKQATPMSMQAAYSNAQRDYDRFFPAPKVNPNDPTKDIMGNPIGPRPVPPEGMQAWLKNRANAYMTGGLGASPQPQAAPAVAPAANNNQPNPANVIPMRPKTVPVGSQYSPSRRMWRDGSGKLYNEAGIAQ